MLLTFVIKIDGNTPLLFTVLRSGHAFGSWSAGGGAIASFTMCEIVTSTDIRIMKPISVAMNPIMAKTYLCGIHAEN